VLKMKRQSIGKILYWIGVAGLLVQYLFLWIKRPTHAGHTPAELSGTLFDPKGALFMIAGQALIVGIGFSIAGVLLFSGKKGSLFWLWGFAPLLSMAFLTFWSPSEYFPPLFGIGGGIITFAYLGSLYLWIKTHKAYPGGARTGKQIKLLGYSFLYVTTLCLCMHMGSPHLPALADTPIPGVEGVLVAFTVGMLLLFIGDYVSARGLSKETKTV
jgi:hypothetical protein